MRQRVRCWSVADDLSAISAAFPAPGSGDGRVVVVAGRAGIGKSSLLAEGQRTARAAGFTVLTARASDLEREFAFGVARQLFERAVQRSPHWWAGAAEQARAVFDDVPAAAGGIFEDVSQSVLHGLYWLVVNATADGPLLLSVDDLQLCDRSSLRFLSYLSRRLDGLPVVVLAGLRTAGQPLADATLADLVRGPRHRGGGTAAADGRRGGRGAAPADGRRPGGRVRRGLPPGHRR